MNEQKPSAFQTALRYGFIAGLISVLHSVIIYVMNVDPKNWINSLIQGAILILFLILAIQYYRDKVLGGYIKYGKALGTGMLMMVVYSIITMIFLIIYINFIDTGFVDKILADAQAKMQEKNMPQDQIDRAMKITKIFANKWIIPVWGFLGSMFWGLIISLIVSAFLQRKDPMEGVQALDSNTTAS